ncbi:MAG: DUF4407 domain-containing protein, partial [Prevotella sp.]|nr:DUF4407 domain-containing protein [Prevotella sp.]
MKNLWIKFGCFLTGWNYQILKMCSEASFKHLKKYTSALLILIIIWAFTGYCFAERYVHAEWWGCLIASFLFIIIVIQIERQIILTVGSAKLIVFLRFFIAIIMAIIGSSIIDQIIFKDDISKKMIEIRDQQVKEQLPNRLEVINARLAELQIFIDSLYSTNQRLYVELSNTQTHITTVAKSTIQTPKRNSEGKIIQVNTETTITTNQILNPRIDQINSQIKINDTILMQHREEYKDYNAKKLNAEKELRAELAAKTGFLEELSAIIQIMTERIEALIFYFVVFAFLMFLELFVVFSKVGDKKCDYDIVVEHQLNI